VWQQLRVIIIAKEWASGRFNEYRLVGVVKNGEPKPVASCSIGFDDAHKAVPGADDDAETKAPGH
jgi:hypothetical protein